MGFDASALRIRHASEAELEGWSQRGENSFIKRVRCVKSWRMLSDDRGSMLLGLLSPLPMCRGHECSVSLARRYAETGDDLRWGFFVASNNDLSAWLFPGATTRTYAVDAENRSFRREFIPGDFDPPGSFERQPRAWFQFVARAFCKVESPVLRRDAEVAVIAAVRRQHLFLDIVRYAVEHPSKLAELASFEMPSPLPTLMESLDQTKDYSFAPTVLCRRNKAMNDLYARCAQAEAAALLLALKEHVWKPFVRHRRRRGWRYGCTDFSDPLVCSRLKKWRVLLAAQIEAQAKKARYPCFEVNVHAHAVLGAPFGCAPRTLIASLGRVARKVPLQELAGDIRGRSLELFRILTKHERRAANAAFTGPVATQTIIAVRAGLDAVGSLPVQTLRVTGSSPR